MFKKYASIILSFLLLFFSIPYSVTNAATTTQLIQTTDIWTSWTYTGGVPNPTIEPDMTGWSKVGTTTLPYTGSTGSNAGVKYTFATPQTITGWDFSNSSAWSSNGAWMQVTLYNSSGVKIATISAKGTGTYTGVKDVLILQAGDSRGGGYSYKTPTLTNTVVTPPATPAGLSVTNLGQQKLSWNANTENDLSGYNVYVDSVKVNTSIITATNYVLTGLTSGSTHTVEITAVNTSSMESPKTSPMTVTAVNNPTITGSGVFQEWKYLGGTPNPIMEPDMTSYSYQRSVNFPISGSTPDSIAWKYVFSSPQTIQNWDFSGSTVDAGHSLSLAFYNASGTRIATAPLKGTGNYLNVSHIIIIGSGGVGTTYTMSTPSVSYTVPPTSPTGVTTVPSNGKVDVAWNSMANATSYNVYVNGTKNNASPITNTSYAVTGLTNGTAYAITVTSVNAGGESPQSAVYTSSPIAPPSAPSNASSSFGDGTANLVWNSVYGANGYNIYQNGSKVNSAPVTSTVYPITGLTNGTNYTFTVASVNAGGESSRTTVLSGTPIAIPSTPTGITTSVNDGSITVGWNPVSGADSYNVVLNGTVVNGSPVTSNTYTITGLQNGTSYSVGVSAVNTGGKSAISSSITATPTKVSDSPSNTTSSFGDSSANLVWGSVYGADSYNIYENGTKIKSVSVPDSVYALVGLTNGTNYTFSITSVNIAGESAQTALLTGTPIAIPTAPTNLTATIEDTKIKLVWNAVYGSVAYNVFMDGINLTSTHTSTTLYEVGNLVNDVNHVYYVTALNSSGESAKSNSVTVASKANVPVPPVNPVPPVSPIPPVTSDPVPPTPQPAKPPTDIVKYEAPLAVAQSNVVEVTFTLPDGTTKAVLQRQKDNGEWTIVGELVDGKFKDTGALPGEYNYRVKLADGLSKEITVIVKGDFKDIPIGFWASDAIYTLEKKDVVSGYPTEVKPDSKAFNPSSTVTRAEFSKILVRALGLEDQTGNNEFSDTSDSWASKYIATATKIGLVVGYGDGTFRPDNNITREEVATVLQRVLKISNKDLEQLNSSFRYKDDAEISDWAKKAVYTISDYKIPNVVDGMYKSKEDTTRAESAFMIVNTLDKIKK